MAEEPNFLEAYMSLNTGTEVPDAFAMWCGIAAISAALGRNSYLKFGQENVYPNLFILLVAGSGTHRKSTAIGRAEKILRTMDPGPNIIAQKITPEALIQSIRKIETKDMTQLLKETATGFVLADELSTFLNRRSYEAGLASLLIPLYDCKDVFTYRTIARQEEKIENGCIGLLAGSTVDWIKAGIPEESVGGGLTSRILFIYCDQPVELVAWPVWTPQHEATKDYLVRKLGQISQIKGEFLLTPDARAFFEFEYHRFAKVEGNAFKNDKSLAGYFSRRHMHMLKVSMCLSAGENTERVIQKRHLDASQHLLSDVEKFLKHVLALITSSSFGGEVQTVAKLIRGNGRVSRTVLLRSLSSRLNARQIEDVVNVMISAGEITIEQSIEGTFYVWVGG